MPRLKKVDHDAMMQHCADRDTEGRIECIFKTVQKHPYPCRGEVLLHHSNNNPNDNEPENLENLCRGHNARTDPRGRQRSPKFNGIKRLLQSREEHERRGKPYEMEKGERAELYFRKSVVDLLRKHGEQRVEDVIDAVKNEFTTETEITISQKALYTYYRAMANPLNGTLEEFEKGEESWVKLKA